MLLGNRLDIVFNFVVFTPIINASLAKGGQFKGQPFNSILQKFEFLVVKWIVWDLDVLNFMHYIVSCRLELFNHFIHFFLTQIRLLQIIYLLFRKCNLIMDLFLSCFNELLKLLHLTCFINILFNDGWDRVASEVRGYFYIIQNRSLNLLHAFEVFTYLIVNLIW